MVHPPHADAAVDESRLEAWEQRTDMPLTVVASVFLLVYAVQVLATRPGYTLWTVLEVALWVVWGVFVVDYVVRLAKARRRVRFVVTHPIDLLVVLAPFFRFLRLLRLLAAVTTLGRVLRDDFRGRVGTSLVVAVSLLSFVAALGVYEAERDAPDSSITTFGDALWWVLTTITTVRYGDRYPVTTEGRLVAAGLMLAGIAVLGTVTAGIASWFLERIGAEAAEQSAPTTPPVGPGPADWDAVLTELRALRRRVDELEWSAPERPGHPAPPPH
ncbi:potassium channel family protein [Pseudonocardia endophytica]|uniref:Voltage-gated potassium channel n=1 Tax=Pseudonocardia endophytica TaxID=401976 RepID=A0A4R1HSR7_PSEEN|nr:potassium channel family protein [Pseudonocardia endophytica]TCK24313.1 voltage-gated potassium channel [Pseudonocardia endophytica]